MNDMTGTDQPEAPSTQNPNQISEPKSLFGSNLTKNEEIMPNCKTTQAYLTLVYLINQYNKLNSSTTKDNNSQQAQNSSEDTKNPLNPIQQDSLSISQLSNIKEVSRSLFLQIQQNDQTQKTKKTKTKTPKKEKKVKDPKEPKPKKHSDVIRPKFIRSKSQPNSTFFGKSEYLLTQKKICIPNWRFIKDDVNSVNITESNDNNDQIPEGKFDEEMHKRLEIYENRIANGLTKYQHPAYSVQLENDESSKEITPTEIEQKKLSNYESFVPQQQIPLFWERRSWDTDESLMTENDSRQLQHKIENEESEESIFNLIKSSPKYKYNRKYSLYSYSSSSSSQSSSTALSPIDTPYNSYSGNTRKKKKESNQSNRDGIRRHFGGTSGGFSYSRKATEIEISNLYYETDESCDETDIELF